MASGCLLELLSAVQLLKRYNKTVRCQTVRSRAPALGTLQMLVARRVTMPVTVYEMASGLGKKLAQNEIP